jgi:uncharacterized membrane protein
MLREHLLEAHPERDGVFRWRGDGVSRIEGLSDAVFGFAITLLVVSLEIPRSVAELLHTMRGFIGFALSFALLFRLWGYQYRFFRRYGLEDPTTIRLNGVLLFVVLFFVYPLKFMTQVLTDFLFGGAVNFRPGVLRTALDAGGLDLMLMFYVGIGTVFLVLGLMYLHAYRMRDHIGLNALESLDTRITCERLMLPLPVFPIILGVMWLASIDAPGRGGERLGKWGALVLGVVGDVTMFAYLGWAFLRVKRLKKQRDALEQGMIDAARGDEGHSVAVAV